MLKTMKKSNIKGFSLIELMVVVAIIGILAAIAVPNFQRFQRKAKQSEARALLGGMATAQEAFRAEYEQYFGDFIDVGFSPAGTLRYNVGFDNVGDVPPAPFVSLAVGHFTTEQFCGDAMYGTSCTGIAQALPATVDSPNYNAATSVADYVAGAAGLIGGANPDHWTMDEQKTLLNVQNGTL